MSPDPIRGKKVTGGAAGTDAPAPGQQPPPAAAAAPPPPAQPDQQPQPADAPPAQRVDDEPQPAEPLSLDSPDDFTFQDGDNPVPADSGGIPMDQWNPEIPGESADFVPDDDDQPIQYAQPGDDPAAEQIRATILARRGDLTGQGG